jgi:hypothetical protein
VRSEIFREGVDLIAADNPGSFIDDTPTAKLVRQLLGAISEFDVPGSIACSTICATAYCNSAGD